MPEMQLPVEEPVYKSVDGWTYKLCYEETHDGVRLFWELALPTKAGFHRRIGPKAIVTKRRDNGVLEFVSEAVLYNEWVLFWLESDPKRDLDERFEEFWKRYE